MKRLLERTLFGLKRPDLAWRKLRGLSAIEIDPVEVRPYLPSAPVIVEAGACDGSDTRRLAETWPRASIHSFEPVPAAFLVVEATTSHLPSVHRYPMALGEKTGTSPMHVSTTMDRKFRPDSSSLRPPADTLRLMPQVAFRDIIEVQTVTLDDWATMNDIDRLDFLWLDMQGVELDVLKASPRTFATVTAVCLEVSRRNLYEGCATYTEVDEWMRNQDFRPVIDRVSLWFGNMLWVR